jgi:glycerol-3-phosphate dehydrogenase
MRRPVGIIGSGSFGIAIAKLINPNTDVLIYTRKAETADAINNAHRHYARPCGNLRRLPIDFSNNPFRRFSDDDADVFAVFKTVSFIDSRDERI